MKKASLFVLVLSSSLYIFNCASMPGTPGYIDVIQSQFDNSVQMRMESAWLKNGNIMMELFWSSNMKKNEIVLTPILLGAKTINNGKSLHFNVDGKIYSLTSIDNITNIKTTPGSTYGNVHTAAANWSSKSYLISREFLTKLNTGNRVIVKLDLNNSYVEDEFSELGYQLAKGSFIEFEKKLGEFNK